LVVRWLNIKLEIPWGSMVVSQVPSLVDKLLQVATYHDIRLVEWCHHFQGNTVTMQPVHLVCVYVCVRVCACVHASMRMRASACLGDHVDIQ